MCLFLDKHNRSVTNALPSPNTSLLAIAYTLDPLQAARQALETLETAVTTSQRQALLGELLWAVQVATDREKALQRQIDLLLEQQRLQLQQQRLARNMTTDVVSEAVSATLGVDVFSENLMVGEQNTVGGQSQLEVETKGEMGETSVVEGEVEGEDVVLARWSIGQVSGSLRELTAAVEACRRLDDMLKVTAAVVSPVPLVKVSNATTFADFLKQTNAVNTTTNDNDVSSSSSDIATTATATATTTINNNDEKNSSQLDAAVNTLLYGDVDLVRRGIEVETTYTPSLYGLTTHPLNLTSQYTLSTHPLYPISQLNLPTPATHLLTPSSSPFF